MHPFLKYINDEIRSWRYESPAQLMKQVTQLLREVLGSGGGRKDLKDFNRLYDALELIDGMDHDEIDARLHRWNALTDSDELNHQQDPMLSFKIGVVWVTSRSLMLFFSDDEKLNTFAEWQDFVCKNIEKVPGVFLPQEAGDE